MRKALIFLTAFIAVPAAVQAQSHRITRPGIDVEYQVTLLSDGVRQISGVDHRTNEPFTLNVNRRWVWGQVGRSEVSFRTPKAKKAKPAATLASN